MEFQGELNPIIAERFTDHLDVFGKTMEQMDVIQLMAERCKEALKAGNKVLFCGNGGSAADAQHLAAELIGRFQKERRSLASIALTTDTSILTAVANDYGYDEVFARQVEGLGRSGDVLIGISTSGNSANVVKAALKARDTGMHTIAFTGEGGGKLKDICDITFAVPSKVTARIQEMHIMVGHIICELVEEEYDKSNNYRVFE
ncbi:D-sedoheptulose 7-phosphate isomerase [Veillonella sp.]|nr:D-sedoheptulose 7-phosphate isomerase [Veillonella sp.]